MIRNPKNDYIFFQGPQGDEGNPGDKGDNVSSYANMNSFHLKSLENTMHHVPIYVDVSCLLKGEPGEGGAKGEVCSSLFFWHFNIRFHMLTTASLTILAIYDTSQDWKPRRGWQKRSRGNSRPVWN